MSEIKQLNVKCVCNCLVPVCLIYSAEFHLSIKPDNWALTDGGSNRLLATPVFKRKCFTIFVDFFILCLKLLDCKNGHKNLYFSGFGVVVDCWYIFSAFKPRSS